MFPHCIPTVLFKHFVVPTIDRGCNCIFDNFNKESRSHKAMVNEEVKGIPPIHSSHKETSPNFVEVVCTLHKGGLETKLDDLLQLHAVGPVDPNYGRLSLIGSAGNHQFVYIVSQKDNEPEVATIHSQVTLDLFERLKQQPNKAYVHLIDAVRRPALIDIVEEEDDMFEPLGVPQHKPLGVSDTAAINNVRKLLRSKSFFPLLAFPDLVDHIQREAVNSRCKIAAL